ncbi:transcriptional regulator, TetR family [Variovorax sp. OK605]|uniref:TetR family transcriptional regulator n=1 Tax=Variovorax sp. OK605 TaxID=1855317 RepID=UPI0008F30A2B|nr:TetR family transcriptional regulator [Variovorax sp. OK605]SFP40389.1 transcriptional regulator, TetR family [Variovorax sp. OK605]
MEKIAENMVEVVPKTTLRERTRLAMRGEVSAIAFRLFSEQGFEKTTVEQIAAEAGLSRTTFFRYFGNKQEIVLEKFTEFGLHVAAALAARPAEERPWLALRRAFDVVVDASTGDTSQSLSLMRLLSEACALMTRQWEKTQGWQTLLVPEISQRLGKRGERNAPIRATALAASAITCLDAATDAWSACNGEIPLAVLLDQAMGALSELE